MHLAEPFANSTPTFFRGFCQFVFTFLFSTFSSIASWAGVTFPTGLTESDRVELTRTFGWGSSGKLLSEPFPLGGYTGLEVGVSVESIPTSHLAYLGNGTAPQQSFIVPKFTMGKGLYNDFDLFFDFMPSGGNAGFSDLGGKLRWGFYQAQFLPVSFSILLHGSSVNVSSNSLANQLICQTYGGDLISGVTFPSFSFYLGGGFLFAHSNLMTSDRPGLVFANDANGFRSFLGGAFHFSDFFLAFEVDQYDQAVFSTKFGLRY